ncbi:C-x8-C-x5-C-x3-H type zinc finger protein-like protein [Xylariaceae sp. FL0255]|nr:C-x8-C-x5-C-x3-H type zinc finger protein-like protein [Xylariaceae sp. FL0255]
MAMGATSIMDFVQRYKDYEATRNTTQELIKDLMIYAEHVESTLHAENSRLNQRIRDLTLDVDDGLKSRKQLQHRLTQVEHQMGYVSLDNDQLKNRNSYVLVLVDGDNLIFREEFLRQGVEGGRRAANELRKAVAEHCAPETEIVAKIIANLTNLNRLLGRNGCVETEANLPEFVTGFNQSKASFDFLDIGFGKERAESKLKDTAKFHLRNYNCKQIVLGISHDAGYSSFIDVVNSDEATKGRITVLEGSPVAREISSTGVTIIRFQDIFRSDKLVDRRTVSSHSVQSGSSVSTGGPAGFSYATITQKASPPPQITLPIPLAPKNTNSSLRVVKQPPKAAWNPGPRGIDPPIPLNQMALETIKKRKDNNKLCNNHFLRGPCSKGNECCFVHDYSPNKDEKNAIAFLARLNPCTNGQDCDVDNCIYGHHCPSVVNGICTHPFCKFRPEEHPPGTKLRPAKV